MRKFLAVLSTVVSLVLGNIALANTMNGLVVGVSDGDTITVLDANAKQNKIRLAGIDAPENAQVLNCNAK